MSAPPQQFCLRWNSHQSNLLTVFDELLQNEAFTDVTLVCEGGSTIKCHRMVLAACSSYFQNIFTDLPCEHLAVVLKDVKHCEIQAILEYMYRGEVNIAQDQLAALLKVAEALKVKGLTEENRSNTIPIESEVMNHSPSVSTTNSLKHGIVHSSTNYSPPHSTNAIHRNPYNIYERTAMDQHNGKLSLSKWTMPSLPIFSHSNSVHSQNKLTTPVVMLKSEHDAVSSDMSHLKRKKMSNVLMQRDTPILRTVLGEGQTDLSQPVSLVCHPESANEHSGCEERITKHSKNEPSEDAHSPFTQFTDRMNDEAEKSKLAIPSSSPQSFSGDISMYVPDQKRYKKYSPKDITAAIEAVRNGMSALTAAKTFKVPPRTLYDKVKKLGVSTQRTFKRSANESSHCFPFGNIYGGHLSESDDNSINNNSPVVEASSFFRQAFNGRGGDERDALTAMAAAANAMASGHLISPNNYARARSPSTSPAISNYMRHSSMTPSPAPGSDFNHSDQTNGTAERDREEGEDQVEDLSIAKRPENMESRVIVPPINHISAIKRKEEFLIEAIKEEARREVSTECVSE